MIRFYTIQKSRYSDRQFHKRWGVTYSIVETEHEMVMALIEDDSDACIRFRRMIWDLGWNNSWTMKQCEVNQ